MRSPRSIWKSKHHMIYSWVGVQVVVAGCVVIQQGIFIVYGDI